MKIVAEIGLSHDGSLGYCYGLIEVLKQLQFDALWGVKFQCHDDDPCCKFRGDTFFPQDHARRAYWKRTAFSKDQWSDLARFVRNSGLNFGVSPFSLTAVDMVRDCVDFWKIGSGQTSNLELIQSVRGDKPVVISTGMSDWAEIDKAAEIIDQQLLTILQCTSVYPTHMGQVGLNVMVDIRKRYGCKFGLSDHSGTIWPGIIAAYMGADMLEVHVCWDKRQWGPDSTSSLTVKELEQLAHGVLCVKHMKPIDKNCLSAAQMVNRQTFRGNSCVESASA